MEDEEMVVGSLKEMMDAEFGEKIENTEYMLLGQDARYDLDTHKTKLNNNVLIVGSPGSGKTRGIVIPNLLQATGSYVVSDPKGNLYDQYGPYLESKGYEVKKIDFINPGQSEHYNPFHYIRNEMDILKMANVFGRNYGSQNSSHKVDPFWDNSSVLLFSAVIAYMKECLVDSEITMRTMFRLLQMAYDTESSVTKLDRLFEQLRVDQKKAGAENSFAVRQYSKFRTVSGADRTLSCIVMSAITGFGSYDTDDIAGMTAYDEVDLPSIGQRKMAVFVVVSDSDRSMDTLANLFFSQAINELCLYADKYGKDNKLPVDVRFILDDFATNCKIDQFPRMIASFRSRGISTFLIIQAESQLKAAYGDDGRTIIGSCDTYVYLGGNDIDTAKSVSERCDRPVTDVLDMPVGDMIIFRRGEHAKYTRGIRLEGMTEYEKAMFYYMRKQRSKERHDQRQPMPEKQRLSAVLKRAIHERQDA